MYGVWLRSCDIMAEAVFWFKIWMIFNAAILAWLIWWRNI